MSEFTSEINTIFSLLTVVGQIAVLILLFLLFRGQGKATAFLGKYAVLFGFIISLGALLGSLLYSDIVGFEPCTLCWYQRIFLYPQVLLFGFALWKKRRDVVDYSLVLSFVGGVIAAYHYYGQMFNASALPCKAAEGVSPCAVRFFVEFSYVTIPMMSLTAFMLLIVFMCFGKKYTHVS